MKLVKIILLRYVLAGEVFKIKNIMDKISKTIQTKK
jgi:hypothetical protein